MTATAPHTHRVSRAVAGIREDLAEVVDASLWSMDAAETAATIEDLGRAEAQLAELKTRLLLHAEAVDVPGQSGATSTPNWHAHHTKLTRRETHRQMRLAHGLEQHDVTRDCLGRGALHVEQAEAILRGLADLPGDADPDLVQRAEAHLIEQARDFDAKALRHLARHVLEVACPDAADAHEAKLLEREEHQAAAATRLTLWDDGHGKLHGRFTLDSAVTGAMLTKALLRTRRPQTPRLPGAARGPAAHPRTAGTGLRRADPALPHQPAPQGRRTQRHPRRAHAARDPDGRTARQPSSTPARPSAHPWPAGSPARPGSSPPSSTVTPRSSTWAARNASTPKPTASRPPSNNAAATSRAATSHPAMTHMHHPIRWADGGGTNGDGIMICPPHHRRAHDPRYTMTKTPHRQSTPSTDARETCSRSRSTPAPRGNSHAVAHCHEAMEQVADERAVRHARAYRPSFSGDMV